MKALDQAYQEIARRKAADKDSRPSPAIFEAVDQLLKKEGQDDIAERVMEASAEAVPWDSIAEVLGIMMWSSPDNGAQIMQDAERWLKDASDERRVFVAMNLDFYPFKDVAQMEAILGKVVETFPGQATLCRSVISSRKGLAE